MILGIVVVTTLLKILYANVLDASIIYSINQFHNSKVSINTLFYLLQAEVYVNSTSDNLVLTNGEVSKHIFKKAGKALQNECNQYVATNGNLQVGDIAVTIKGKISCKFIIHTVGKGYDASDVLKSEQVNNHKAYC